MQPLMHPFVVLVAWTLLAAPRLSTAQVAGAIPPGITTPDKVESRLGPLEFKDGSPSKGALEKVYDHLNFTHAFRAFVDTLQGVSMHAIRKGFHGRARAGSRFCACTAHSSRFSPRSGGQVRSSWFHEPRPART
jgi:hypothetical protein